MHTTDSTNGYAPRSASVLPSARGDRVAVIQRRVKAECRHRLVPRTQTSTSWCRGRPDATSGTACTASLAGPPAARRGCPLATAGL
jgi:hypothetical protein